MNSPDYYCKGLIICRWLNGNTVINKNKKSTRGAYGETLIVMTLMGYYDQRVQIMIF